MKTLGKFLFLLSFSACCFSNSLTYLKNNTPYNSHELETIKAYLFANIATQEHVFSKAVEGQVIKSLPGAVLASPSYQDTTFFQDYQFHWVRDAAITMDEVTTLYDLASQKEKKQLHTYLENYINFESLIQKQHGEESLGEPKYNIDGSVWQGPWGRPQYDGPALRAITLIHIANSLLKQNEEDYVHSTILPLIITDLDFVMNKWQEKAFDLWEELNDTDHFFTKMVQRKAFVLAANFFNQMNDPAHAQNYQAVAAKLSHSLEQHWNANRGYVTETIHQQFYKGGGLNAAIILGALYGNLEDPNDPFAINSNRVMNSIYYIRHGFKHLYRVNIDNHYNPPLLGRYPSDVYDGMNDTYGNPWFLTTHQLAEYYYTLTNYYLNKKAITITADNFLFFHQVNHQFFSKPEVISFDRNPARFYQAISELIQQGDDLLHASKKYTACYNTYSCTHMSEQIDRKQGEQVSAKDLTWSYATLLTAMQTRLKDL